LGQPGERDDEYPQAHRLYGIETYQQAPGSDKFMRTPPINEA
jgi:hypothetical protein